MLAPLLAALALGVTPASPGDAAPPPPPPPTPDAPAQAAAEVRPARVRPGDAFLVLVRGVSRQPAAQVAGRSLTFFKVPEGWAAVAGLPVEQAPGPLPIAVALPQHEVEGPAALATQVEVEAPHFARQALKVQDRYVKPPPPEVQRRVEADRAAFAAAFAQPPRAPFFSGPFAWPRDDRVTAHYGEERTLNGVKPSQHYGLDMAGTVGAPVAAANAGQVVLVRDAWASGWSVVVWHGAGLFTTYLHLNRVLVREGDQVARGQQVGEVGQTGRATGPHLHWGFKVNDLYVDPESVLRLALQPAP